MTTDKLLERIRCYGTDSDDVQAELEWLSDEDLQILAQILSEWVTMVRVEQLSRRGY